MNNNINLITKIEIQKKNKDRVNVFIDKEYSFSCSSELVYKHGLKINKSVNIEELKIIVNEDNFFKCKNAALKIIEKGYKSEKEVFDKLIKKEYDDKIIARAIEFLKTYNFINDEEYTKLYLKDKIKSQGKNKIKHSLQRKGIAEDIIELHLKDLSLETETKTALKLADKKYRILLKSEHDIKKISKKLWDFLLRNGYHKDIIEEVLVKVVREEDIEKTDQNIEVDLNQIHELAEKRYKIIEKTESDKRKQYKKLTDYLLRRGYSWENIKDVLKNILSGEEVDE